MCVHNTRASIESLRASLSRITPIPTGRISVKPEDKINDDDPAGTQLQEEARDPHNEDQDEHEDDPTLPNGEDNRGRNDIFSMITEDDQSEMLQHNRMLLIIQFQQQAEWRNERTRMLTELDHSRTSNRPEIAGNQSEIFKMVDP